MDKALELRIDRLAGIEGLQTITSRSQDGESDITLEFAPGRNVDIAANDVRDRVGSAIDELPDEVQPYLRFRLACLRSAIEATESQWRANTVRLPSRRNSKVS